jgi:methylenetetrahydrofolate dehydrogenase (NADP+)/methenyltetrahydrofolate cyclohydrolase/formyltetrahydrofolate synthetase
LYTFSDIQISRSQTPKDVTTLAKEIGVLPSELELYGTKKAKLSLKIVERLRNVKDGKYVVVAGYFLHFLRPRCSRKPVFQLF